MYLTCKCLNVTIKLCDNCELKTVRVLNYRDTTNIQQPLDSPVLPTQQQKSSTSIFPPALETTASAATTTRTITSPLTTRHSPITTCEFFHQQLVTITDVTSKKSPSSFASSDNYEIIKHQPFLINTTRVANWIINRCVNCMTYTHALNTKVVNKNGARVINTDTVAATNMTTNKNNANDSFNDNESDKNNDNYDNHAILINKDMVLPTDGNNDSDNSNVYEKLKLNDNYSKIYKVIIDKNLFYSNNTKNDDNDDDDDDDNDDDYSLLMKKKLSTTLQLIISNLQLQYEMGFQNMKEKVEKKIQKFAAEQYEYLDNFKEHGHKEYRTLVNRIYNNKDLIQSTMPIDTSDNNKRQLNNLHNKILPTDKTALPTVQPQPHATFNSDIKSVLTAVDSADTVLSARLTALSMKEGLLSSDKTFLSAKESVLPANISNTRNLDDVDKTDDGNLRYLRTIQDDESKSKNLKKEKKRSIRNNGGDEEIFSLDGMDDMELDNVEVTDDEADTDDSGQDEGIYIPRGQRGGHPTIAKSLPVSVPNFSFGRRIQDQDDDQLSMNPLDPHNIRASIKALAKSVHGDTVFGDLPRPRFSTEI